MTYFAMFTDTGNQKVAAIVDFASKNHLGWQEVMPLLRNLADQDGFGEAMDTAVRECVYEALLLTTDFYI